MQSTDAGDFAPPPPDIPTQEPAKEPRRVKKRITAPPPDAAKTADIPFLGTLTALASGEANSLREPLVDGFLRVWELTDETITHTNRARAEAQIWVTIDREDTGILVDALLSFGRANPVAAQAVRGIATLFVQLEIGMILVPRFWRTWNFYLQHGGFAFLVPTIR